MMTELQRQLRSYIVDNYFFDRHTAFSDSDSFLALGIIDSTGVLELVSHLEESFGVVIDTEEIVPDNFDSVEQLARFVRRKLAESGSFPAASHFAGERA